MDSHDHAFEGARPGVHGENAVLHASTVGARSIVAMGSVIPPGFEVPAESFVRETPASVTPLAGTDIDRETVSGRFASGEYAHLGDGHDDLFG
jgi:carbonic anhydrase/acetyltransferase-like protein (isoleucine patch superfamily)